MTENWGGVGSNKETHMFLVNAENDQGAWTRLRDQAYQEIVDEPEISDDSLGSWLVAVFRAYLQTHPDRRWVFKVEMDVGDWSKVDRAYVARYVRDTMDDMLRGTNKD